MAGEQVTTIDIPGVGPVDFPSSMPEAEMTAAAKRLHDEHAYTPDPTMQSATARAMARASGAILPPRKVTDELGNEVGGMADGPAKRFIGNVVNNPIAEGAAHPSTVGDLSSLLLPSGFGGAMRGAKDTASAVGEGLSRIQLHPSALMDIKLNQPLKFMKDLVSIGPKANPALPLAQDLGPSAQVLHGAEQFREPYQVPAERVPQSTGATTAPPTGPPTLEELKAAGVGQGSLRAMQAQGMITPVASHPPSVPEIAPVASHPLIGPRVDVGAEVVGRQAGMSKQAVREATGPILGEARGEASHVLPEQPLQRIIDTMKALPKEGDARTAYVAAAKDPKTMAQLENLRRTLKHLGLGTAAAVGSRQMLLGQLDAGE